jgi:hypothetical protein
MGSEDDIKAVGALFAKYASITTADDAASRIKDIVTALHAAHVTSASAADATADKSASSSGKYNPDGPKAQKERTPEQQARKDRQALARAEAQQRRLAARILARESIAATDPRHYQRSLSSKLLHKLSTSLPSPELHNWPQGMGISSSRREISHRLQV